MENEVKACSNTNPCTCPKTDCPRHGRCCECVKFHRDVKGNVPNCFKLLGIGVPAKN